MQVYQKHLFNSFPFWSPFYYLIFSYTLILILLSLFIFLFIAGFYLIIRYILLDIFNIPFLVTLMFPFWSPIILDCYKKSQEPCFYTFSGPYNYDMTIHNILFFTYSLFDHLLFLKAYPYIPKRFTKCYKPEFPFISLSIPFLYTSSSLSTHF